jgi:sugar lactone lactonase YvrE
VTTTERPVARIVARTERDLLGEGPVWVAERGRLFWVDILAPAVRWLDLVSGATGTRAFAEPIGWIIPRRDASDFIVGLKSGFHLFDLEADRLTPIGNPEVDRPDNRLNDAKADSAGRIWAGSKNDVEELPTGALYRLDTDLRWTRVDDGYLVANGPAFSPDGRTLYHTDSSRRVIYAFDLAEDGGLAARREFIRFEEQWGYPDGMATDVEGGLWVAHWNGSRITRFSPAGAVLQVIPMPARNITSMAFAGPNLDRLFVTSAADGSADDQLGGALFELAPGVSGLPSGRFRSSLPGFHVSGPTG